MTVCSVAMVSPYDLSVPGGVQGQVQALSRELARRGRVVTVVSPGSTPDPSLARAGVTHLVAGRSHAMPGNGSRAPVMLSARDARWAQRCLRDARTSIVHLHEPLAPVIGWPLMAAPEGALVATFHRSGDDAAYRALGQLIRPWSRNIDVAVAVSDSAAATASQCARASCEVLFNGIDVDSIVSAAPWPTSRRVVLFLGRDEPRKGRSVLVDAAAQLPDDVEVWVTGNAPNDRADPGGAKVTFLGRISEAEKLQRLVAADVLCAPSLGGESFGMVLLEGLAANCEVVASDIDGYREALGGLGKLVAPGDVDGFAFALRRALEHEGMPTAAKRAHVERWSIARLADAYEDCYARAAAAATVRRQR